MFAFKTFGLFKFAITILFSFVFFICFIFISLIFVNISEFVSWISSMSINSLILW